MTCKLNSSRSEGCGDRRDVPIDLLLCWMVPPSEVLDSMYKPSKRLSSLFVSVHVSDPYNKIGSIAALIAALIRRPYLYAGHYMPAMPYPS